MRTLSFAICLYFLLCPALPGQGIRINEFMGSNNAFLLDEDGEDSDWLEIMNASADSLSLSGYSLSDKLDNVDKWLFPDSTLAPNGFLIVFASDKNRSLPGKQLHANFKIETSGEDLILGYQGIVVQHIRPVELKENTSYGASPDGTFDYAVFSTPSPGKANGGEFHDDVVQVSKPGGVYQGVLNVSLSCRKPTHVIRYTLDGSAPTAASTLYTAPLHVMQCMCSQKNISSIQISPPALYNPPAVACPKCVILKCAVFDANGRQASEVETHTYFHKDFGNDHKNLPVMSISVNHDDLFDDSTGIMVPGIYWDANNPDWSGNYFRRGSAWERTAQVEFYEACGTTGFRQQAGLRIHGGFTRRYPQKGFTLYARSEHGNNEIRYRLFDEIPLESFRRLVLRPFSASVYATGVEDYIAGDIAADLNVEALVGRPVVLYLNGEYWGLYCIQERFDEHYLHAHLGIPDDSVDIIESWWGIADPGDSKDFLKLYAFMQRADMKNSLDYDTARQWIDIDNFIDYQLLEIFIANSDWPVNNMKMWRQRKEGARWRWAFYDGDASFSSKDFAGFENALCTEDRVWPSNAMSTLFLRKLLENPDFHYAFLNRLEYLLNTAFSPGRIVPYFGSIAVEVCGEIRRQIDRFSSLACYDHWLYAIGPVYDFLRFRQCAVVGQVAERFNTQLSVSDCPSTLSVSPEKRDEAHICNFALYPNPTRGACSLSFDAATTGSGTMSLTNLLGQDLHTSEQSILAGHNRIDISTAGIPPGLYLLRLQFLNKQHSTRLVITD